MDDESHRPLVKDILSEDFLKTDFRRSVPRWIYYLEDASWKDVVKGIGPLAALGPRVFGSLVGGKIGYVSAKTLGIRSKKTSERMFPCDYVSVILSLAFSLHDLKLNIVSISDTPTGAMCEVELPTDWRSFAGKLYFEIVENSSSRTSVFGMSEIKGQLFDWGKGKKQLEAIFSNMVYHLKKAELQ